MSATGRSLDHYRFRVGRLEGFGTQQDRAISRFNEMDPVLFHPAVEGAGVLPVTAAAVSTRNITDFEPHLWQCRRIPCFWGRRTEASWRSTKISICRVNFQRLRASCRGQWRLGKRLRRRSGNLSPYRLPARLLEPMLQSSGPSCISWAVRVLKVWLNVSQGFSGSVCPSW